MNFFVASINIVEPVFLNTYPREKKECSSETFERSLGEMVSIAHEFYTYMVLSVNIGQVE